MCSFLMCTIMIYFLNLILNNAAHRTIFTKPAADNELSMFEQISCMGVIGTLETRTTELAEAEAAVLALTQGFGNEEEPVDLGVDAGSGATVATLSIVATSAALLASTF